MSAPNQHSGTLDALERLYVNVRAEYPFGVRDWEIVKDGITSLEEQLEAAERERDEWRDRTRNVTEWWQSTKEQYEGEKARADRNQHHLNVERDANAKTVKYLNEQYEQAQADIAGLCKREEVALVRARSAEEQFGTLRKALMDIEDLPVAEDYRNEWTRHMQSIARDALNPASEREGT